MLPQNDSRPRPVLRCVGWWCACGRYVAWQGETWHDRQACPECSAVWWLGRFIESQEPPRVAEHGEDEVLDWEARVGE